MNLVREGHTSRRKMLKEEETTRSHGYVHGQTRRSERIWALEEKARRLSLQRHAQKPPPSETNQKKRRGRKRKSLLLDMAVNSVAPPTYDKEGENPKDDDALIKTDQPANLSLQGMPKKQTLEFILDILQRRDRQEIFAQPVDPDEVVGYYDIINNPMDFGTVRAKLQEGMYTSLEQFQHDVFLICSNAMKFNSSATVYYTEARAISELAQRVFNSLRNEPEKFELEHLGMRRRPAKKGQSEAGSILNKLAKLAGSRGGASLNKTSLNRATQTHLASTSLNPLIDRTNNEMPSGSRDDRNLESSETVRRMTYMPQTSSLNGNGSIVSAVYNAPKLLTSVPNSSIRYMESLMQFVKDLGPTAQTVADKKLGKHPIETPNFLSWMPTSFSKKTDPLVPVSSALDRPARLTAVNDGRTPHNSFNSITPGSGSGSYKGKMVCQNGGVNGYNTGEMIPTRNCLQGVRGPPNNGGSNNFALMGEKAVNTSKNMDACGSSEAKMRGTSGNVDLLVATLMQISAFKNRNSQRPSGHFPLTGIHPAQPSQLITEPRSWLLNNDSDPMCLSSLSTKLASTSRAATSLPGFDFQYPINGEGSSSGAAAVLVDHKYGTKPAQAVQQFQPAERIQPPPPCGPQAIYNNVPIMRKMVSEQQILSAGQNALTRQQQSQVASMQAMPVPFGTPNFVEGASSQVHQAESSGQYFPKTQQLTLVDNQQLDPDLALQL